MNFTFNMLLVLMLCHTRTGLVMQKSDQFLFKLVVCYTFSDTVYVGGICLIALSKPTAFEFNRLVCGEEMVLNLHVQTNNNTYRVVRAAILLS